MRAPRMAFGEKREAMAASFDNKGREGSYPNEGHLDVQQDSAQRE